MARFRILSWFGADNDFDDSHSCSYIILFRIVSIEDLKQVFHSWRNWAEGKAF
jgi:hypothetical protein